MNMSLIKKIRLLVFFILFFMAGISVMCTPRNDEQQVVIEPLGQENSPSINAGLILTEDELSQKIPDALNGDQMAAYKIALHFHMGPARVQNMDKTLEWLAISVENGNSEAQYVLATIMINRRSHNEKFYTRGIFWLYGLARIAYMDTEAMLNRNGYTLETARPPDDSGFPFDYTKLFETELVKCEEGALRGNIKASLLLAKHYEEITGDNELAEYWYRIGAQNGSLECQYKLSQILSRKDDQLAQIRYKFWFDRVIKDGYDLNNGNDIL